MQFDHGVVESLDVLVHGLNEALKNFGQSLVETCLPCDAFRRVWKVAPIFTCQRGSPNQRAKRGSEIPHHVPEVLGFFVELLEGSEFLSRE